MFSGVGRDLGGLAVLGEFCPLKNCPVPSVF